MEKTKSNYLENKKAIEVFHKEAKKNMVEFDLISFQKTHPKLLKSIIESMLKFSEKINKTSKK